MTQRSTGQSGERSKRSDRSFARRGTRRKLGVLYRLAPGPSRSKPRTVAQYTKTHDEHNSTRPDIVAQDRQAKQVWPRRDSLQSDATSPSPVGTHDRRLSRLHHSEGTRSSILAERSDPQGVGSSSRQEQALPRWDVDLRRPDGSAGQGSDISRQSLGFTRPALVRVNAGVSSRSTSSRRLRNLIGTGDQMGYFDIFSDHKSGASGTSLSTTQLFSAGQSRNPLLYGMSKEERL